jgi:predicted nucleic acid-binding protein
MGCATSNSADSMALQAGSNESEILIRRVASSRNTGYKERIYVDGVRKLMLANGETGKIIVSNGEHIIYAELHTMTTEAVAVTVNSETLKLMITPYSMRNFVIEPEDGSAALAPAAPPKPAGPSASDYNDQGVEGSLERAADKLIEKIPAKSRIAIVYVTSNDPEITEFIANELEFIMVNNGLIMIDRSQLDRIRREQNFQISGDVNDEQAVSIGKIAGANIIITGAVTGTGNLRRLRLRALDTQTAQVLTAASERY